VLHSPKNIAVKLDLEMNRVSIQNLKVGNMKTKGSDTVVEMETPDKHSMRTQVRTV